MVVDGQITKNQFLTKSTTGLRVTILSTIQLSRCLLSCGFHYVLSSKFNQDPIEVPNLRNVQSLTKIK
jgi:hypothetical protein